MVNVGASVESLSSRLVQDPGLCSVLTPFLPLTLGYVFDELFIQLPVQGKVFLGMGRSSWAGACLVESI